MSEFEHLPVMVDEVIESLDIKPDGIYVDGTLGGGGHASMILEKLDNVGSLIGIDQDVEALGAARIMLEKFSGKIVFVRDNFANLSKILTELKIEKVDGIFLDLGVSSYQIDKIERGFSFRESTENQSQKLDMRMDLGQDFSALDVVNKYSEDKLRELFYKYGEEPFARGIARRIVRERDESPIVTIGDLMEIIKKSTPPKYRFSRGGGTWASNVFRAIRIEVNDELTVVDEVIPQAIESLNAGGRLAIITFHSLEDRIVKHTFRGLVNDDGPKIKLITKRPIVPSEDELEKNSRAKSAKLRVVEKI